MMRKLIRYIHLALVFVLGMGASASLHAQDMTPVPDESVPLQITAVSAAEFPTIWVQVTSADPTQPLPPDLEGLRLREGEQDILDFEMAPLTVGFDAVLVIDANEAILVVDEGEERSRWREVQASVGRLADQFMRSTEGAEPPDRVSLMLPNAGDGHHFLAQDVTSPDELNAIIGEYELTNPPFTTPLAEMLSQAIAHLAAQQEAESRYQAILLYTNGAQLNQQLNFEEIAVAAQEADVPIFAAILGSEADAEEIANVTRLTRPTRGEFVHMPGTTAADAFYQLWQQQGQGVQLTYRSRQNESGSVDVTVALDNRQASATYRVDVVPPAVTIQPPQSITREGVTAEAALAELEPAQVMVPVQVDWSDGQRRSITAVSLWMNGRPQAQLSSPDLSSEEMWEMPWDISALDAGTYTLTVQVQDDLGLTARSNPVPVVISLSRPTPTSAPAPAEAAEAAVSAEETPALMDESVLLIAVGGLLLVLLLLTLNQWWRRRQPSIPVGEATDTLPEAMSSEEEGALVGSRTPSSGEMVAILRPVDVSLVSGMVPVRLEKDDVTLGRDGEEVDVVIDHESVAPLHARIKRADDTYWLYDEGSASGTYLEFERLGLGPRILYDQNRIRLGRVQLIFRLRPKAASSE